MNTDKPTFKVQMEAVGAVTYPDGTTKEIILRAERPLTDEEFEHGNHTLSSSTDSSD